jgi:hypothetical protein
VVRLERLVVGKPLRAEGVDEVQDARVRAVVAGQLQPALRADRRAQLLEQGDLGSAEPVDGLLGVADREQLVVLEPDAAEQLDQLHLHRVGVLHLVQEQVAIPLTE